MADMKTKQIKPPQEREATSEYAIIDGDGAEVGRVYRRPTTKTGFRHGYCIGQVSTFGWFGRVSGGYELGAGRSGPKWHTKKAAVTGIVAELETP